MKKNYNKPTMQVVEIQHYSFLCGSPDGLGGYKMNMCIPTDPEDTEQQISSEGDVW